MSDVPSRLLRETLRDRLEPPSSGCLDVDTLAAWVDGSLSRRERTTAESHVAACARCQAMLAAMARTADQLPARKWWQAPTVRWLVPIATMSALAIAVWLNTPAQRLPIPAATRTDSRAINESAPAPAALPTDAAGPEKAKETPTPASEQLPDLKRTEQRAARPAQPNTPATAANAAPPTAAPAAPSSIAPQEPAAASTFRARDASRNAFVAPAPAAVQAPVAVSSAAAPRALAESAAAREKAGVDRLSIGPLEIPSPDRNVRWRIVDGTSIERSTNGGAAWQAQSAGAPVRLTAGAAPSPTICWLVGPGGVVLLSQDGRTWQRVVFPEAIDLTAIRATDALNATATAADGRVFITADGGKTWR